MKAILGDRNTVRDGIKHFFVADVFFAAFIGGSIAFILLFAFGRDAQYLFQGIGGIIVDTIVTWFSVASSARLLVRNRTTDGIGVALVSTGVLIVTSLASLPLIYFFSELARVTPAYLVMKESVHACVFYTASVLYFTHTSPHSLMKDNS